MMTLWLLSAKLCGCLNARTAAAKTELLIAIVILVSVFSTEFVTSLPSKPKSTESSDIKHRNTATAQSGGAATFKKIRQ